MGDTVLGEETSIGNSVVCLDSLWLIPPCVTGRNESDPLHNATNEMLHTMYTLGLFADVKVTCGDKVFNLHKSVLSAWSEVFLAMFSSPMRESGRCAIVRNELSRTLSGTCTQSRYRIARMRS